jgi:hypothetical protein
MVKQVRECDAASLHWLRRRPRRRLFYAATVTDATTQRQLFGNQFTIVTDQ